ncbi:MAG: tRNA (N(6)-L-threonylcarbamoyladenosine(37)-C(2))-methylthiotransferase MtaB [Omnitrophica bacterium]|nr:tRNA (N(6)-L-threonylcarbamoyladenosine(37)-C(2))-methylthiotransferase MtaB [Candidatus Omnitrophota bacterium]
MKVKFLTLGCKVNQYETQALREKFQMLGVRPTKTKADLCVVNTCTVTARADLKSRDIILRAKRENPHAKIAVCGCLVQLNHDFINNLGVDYIIPQDKKHLLPEIVLGSAPERLVKSAGDVWSLKITHFSNQRAFVKVQDGCDKFCSYCKIPYLRGPSRSRDKQDIIAEVKRISFFHKEIVLCGANLGLYGKDLKSPQSLDNLTEDILSIPSLGRLRLSSLEPLFASNRLFSLLKSDKLCPHFHFPFQYGDDRILEKMNKLETVSLYEEKVFRVREINPDIAISCDVMVGFPYEDDGTFKNTVEFLNRIKPMRIHIFTFSPREKTVFEGLKVKNKKDIKCRYNFLRRLADNLSFQYKEKFLGKVLNMVAETQRDRVISGYTQNYIKVYIKDNVTLGEVIPVRIERIVKGKAYARAVK